MAAFRDDIRGVRDVFSAARTKRRSRRRALSVRGGFGDTCGGRERFCQLAAATVGGGGVLGTAGGTAARAFRLGACAAPVAAAVIQSVYAYRRHPFDTPTPKKPDHGCVLVFVLVVVAKFFYFILFFSN